MSRFQKQMTLMDLDCAFDKELDFIRVIRVICG